MKIDVIVIGGGIAGRSTALAAASRGLRVTVVDSPRPGTASTAAAGMLAPSLEGMPVSVKPHALEARDLYPAFLAELRERSGITVPLNRLGIIEVATSDLHMEQMFSDPGEAELLDHHALARLEPAFSGQRGARLHRLDGSVDNVTLMTALEVASEREPRITRVSDSVVRVDLSAEPIVTTATSGDMRAPVVVLASGAWASGLPGLPRALPVRPLHGQLMRLDASPIEHVAYAGGGYFVPRGGSVVVGATSEETGFHAATTPRGLATLMDIASAGIASLAHATVADHWSGLRPVTPDALPFLGPDPEFPALKYACGFSRNGILLAPWAASLLADEIVGERPTAPLNLFSITRFKA